MQYEYLVTAVVDVGDEPAPIVADIEYHANAGFVRIPPRAFDVLEVPPIG